MKVHQSKFCDWWLNRFGRIGFSGVRGLIVIHSKMDLDDKEGKCLVVHELVHQEQMRRMGYVRWLVKYIWDWARAGFRYSRDLPLEVEAYEAQQLCLSGEERMPEELDEIQGTERDAG